MSKKAKHTIAESLIQLLVFLLTLVLGAKIIKELLINFPVFTSSLFLFIILLWIIVYLLFRKAASKVLSLLFSKGDENE